MSTEQRSYDPPDRWPSLDLDSRIIHIEAACQDVEGPFGPIQSADLSDEVIRAILEAFPVLSYFELTKIIKTVIEGGGSRWGRSLIVALKGKSEWRGHPGADLLSGHVFEILPAVVEGLADPDPEVRDTCGWILHFAKLEPPIEDLFGGLVRVGPRIWPSRHPLSREPGDLSQFIGPEEGPYHPFRAAPVFDKRGGVIYFGDSPNEDEFRTLLSTLGVRGADRRNYVAFVERSKRPQPERYLYQMRLVTDWALGQLFRAESSPGKDFLQQPRPLGDALWGFIGHQQALYGTIFVDPRAPAGALGGDSEYAREQLAFGLMTELPGVYRIWSRPWLVEK